MPLDALTDSTIRIAREVLAFLLAADCPGCGVAASLLCSECAAHLTPDPVALSTPGGIPVHAALSYGGVPARCIRRLKEDGQTLLARPLGAALGAVLRDTAGSALLVPIPTGRAAFRRRGYRVPELLVRNAGRRPVRLLSSVGARADQRELGRAAREVNVRGSMRSNRRASVAGTGAEDVVIVDDVVTTGATIDEAARVLRRAGFRVVAAVALAATPKRSWLG